MSTNSPAGAHEDSATTSEEPTARAPGLERLRNLWHGNKRRKRVIQVMILGSIIAAILTSGGKGFQPSERRTKGAYLPTFTAESLAGDKWTFPRDLNTDRTIIALAFEQSQQSEVDTWVPAIDALLERNKNISFFEFPTLTNRRYYNNPAFRSALASGMRSGIPSQTARARTITLYVDVPAFLEELGVKGTKSIYVLVVDRQGKLVGHERGSFTDEKGVQLQSFISPKQE